MTPPREDEPLITILMCTHNGARFLAEQLLSITQQSHRNWRLMVSDDGSTDRTLEILAQFQASTNSHRVNIREGPRRGHVRNYLELTSDATVNGDFFAFCDQDDIWEPDKLARALDWLTKVPLSVPALYCSRTRYVDVVGRDIGFSRLFTGVPCFSNALVQSIAGGNTMVFNEAARGLIHRCKMKDAPAHDWLLYLLVSATESAIKYDPYPSVRYRLHEDNVLGHPDWLARLDMLLNNRFRNLVAENLAILNAFRPYMSAHNRAVLDEFSSLRGPKMLGRIRALYRSEVHRKSLVGNVGLLVAVVLRKL